MLCRYGFTLACAVTVLALSQNAAADPRHCKPTLIENFENELDSTVWRTVEGDGCDIGLCGWGNSEVQHYAHQAVRVVDGVLSMTVAEKDGRITSGKLVSEGLFSQQYGRFEARINLPNGRGLWPAFWMMPQSERPWPLAGEIDIMEWTGNEPNRLIGAAHFGPLPPNNVHYSETLRLPAPWNEGWHEFAVEWAPGRIHWEVDGRTHSTMTPDNILPHPWVFDHFPFYLILNLAVGGTLGGEVYIQDLPATMLVDWIKVYPLTCDPENG
ncbi:MAG: glycoside hydrolase family 16 protein [Luminiphilus sp.]|nr:glycoside hydrolase family 16 protein [Luminiphilus sp.]